MYVKILGLKETVYTDQTGQFLSTSRKCNHNVMVAIHADASYIFMEPMKNRAVDHMIKTYQKIFSRMTAAGLGVEKHYLDNEA